MAKKQPALTDLSVVQKALQLTYQQSLYRTAKYLCGYHDINEHTHGKMIGVLESELKRKLVTMPRGTFKTSLAVVAFIIREIIKNPDVRILLDSELWTLSRNSLREIKAHLKGENFQSIFPGWRLVLENQDEITINQRTVIRKEPTVTASGIGAGKTGQHYDCLAPTTKVWTSNGWFEAQAIRPAMRVYTSSGSYESVVAVEKKRSQKRMLRVRAQYQPAGVDLTEDHRLLVFREHKLQWVEAKQLQEGDYFAIPKPKGENRQISRVDSAQNNLLKTPEVWRLIGYWLAEGCASQGNQIRLAFGRHEAKTLVKDAVQIIERFLGVKASTQITKSNTCVVQCHHAAFKEITKRFGTHAYNKHIPPFVLNAPNHKKIQLVKGYFAGDGCFSGPAIMCNSVSENLITGMQLLLASLDIPAGMQHRKIGGKRMVVGNECSVRDSFVLSTTNTWADLLFGDVRKPRFPTKPTRSFFTPDYWMVPLVSVEQIKNGGVVYDIQVDSTHDFYCQGMIAHNCIIADDLNSPQNSLKPEMAEKVINHYRYYTSILEPGGTIVVIGTRYSEMDLIGHIIRTEVEGLDP